jgi:hypothetical protein
MPMNAKISRHEWPSADCAKLLLASHESSSWNTLLTSLKMLDSLRLCFTVT